MEPRALRHISQIPSADRLPIIQTGLALLVPHIVELSEAARSLRNQERTRAAKILESFATEEAAKVLILLDMIRHGWKNNEAIRSLSRAFYDHLSRGLYIRISSSSPASFGEVRSILDHLRPSRYLDGPNDVDWEFRNEIESTREEAMYVDIVKDDDGLRWVAPQQQNEFFYSPEVAVVNLVLALDRLGVLTIEGLNLLEDSWNGVDFVDELSWVENHEHTRALIQALHEQDLLKQEASQHDINYVLERWSFPMGTLDLTQRKVTQEELEQTRAKAAARFEAEMYAEYVGEYESSGWS